MRTLAVITLLLWLVLLLVRIQWVLPGQEIRVEAACGCVFIMHNTAGSCHASGVTLQTGLALPLLIPRVIHYSGTLGVAYLPMLWIAVAAWLATSRAWLLRVMMVCDIIVMLVGVGLVAYGFRTTTGSQIDPDTIVPMAIGFPFVLLGLRGARAVYRYGRDAAARGDVIRSAWFIAVAWGIAAVFTRAWPAMLIILVVLAVLVTRALRAEQVPVEPESPLSAAD